MNDEDSKNVSANPSRILMSDMLKGVIDEDIDPTNELAAMAQNYIMAIVGVVTFGSNERPIVGTLEGMMYNDSDLEIELKTLLEDGLALLKSAPTSVPRIESSVNFVELHNDQDVACRFESNHGFEIRGVRVVSIDYKRRMCVLMLNLRKKT